MNVNSMTYPEKISGLSLYGGGGIVGGIDWGATGIVGHAYKFGDVLFFDLMFDENNKCQITVIEFPNAYTLRIDFELVPSGVGAYIYGTSSYYDENGDLDSNIGTFAISEESIFSQGDYYVFKVAFSTNYTYVPTYGVTNPSSFGLFACNFDRLSYKYDCPLIVSGNETTQQAIVEAAREYAHANYITFHWTAIWTITDTEAFGVWLHERGEPFTEPIIYDPPAGEDDTSEPGGGGGNYDDTSDPIDFPDLPTGGALECGAVKAHRVSKQTLEAIFSKLWSSSIFDPTTMWQKSLQNPMDAIVSLHALPLSPVVTTATNIDIGNFDTQLTSPEVISQYVDIDCGSINVNEYWGSALDYSPYTRAEIYLPFIGIKDVAIEDVMKSTVHIKYHVDVLTGECVAFIKCGLSVLYNFKGNCKMDIPLSASSMDLIQNTLGAMGHIVSSAAMGAAVGGGAGALAGTVMSSAANVASTKIRTVKSGDMSGSSSLMSDFVPYIILHRPVQSLAKDYNKFKGYPSNITAKLGSLTGYTEVEHIHLQGIPNATSEEMEEIVSLLKSGIII